MKAFLLGLLAIFWSTMAMGGTLYTFNGGGTSGTWNTAATWTTDPTGSTSINARVPSTGDVLVVTNSFVLSLTADVTLTSLAVTVQRGGVLDMGSNKFTGTLDSLSGKGTLRIGAPNFPTVTSNNFDDANTGTVEFYNWTGSQALPIPGSGMYNNLRLLNTTGTSFTAFLNGNLTVNGALTLTRTNTTAFPTGNSYADAAATATAAGVKFLLGSAAANRALSVYGDLTVGGGTLLGVNTAANGIHTLTAYGNFYNNGTVNLHNGTANDNQVAVLVFAGTQEATFSCAGDTDLDILKVDKGIDSQVLLNVTGASGLRGSVQGNLRLNHVGASSNTYPELLWLVNGITKLGDNIYLTKIHNNQTANNVANSNTNSNNWFELGSSTTSPTLWLNGATVVNDNATTFVIYGILRVSKGQLQTLTSDAIVVREDAQVLIEGGLVLCEKFRPSLTSAGHRGSFIMTGGTFECRGSFANSYAASPDYGFARFAVPYLTQAFRMSGGTIRVYNTNLTASNNSATGLFHIGVSANNALVTGGTIELNLPNSNFDGQVLSTAPLWNVTTKRAGSTGTSKAILANVAVPTANPFSTPNNLTSFATTTAQPLTVQNNFVIDGTNATAANPITFDAAGKDLTIQGTMTVNPNTVYRTGTNTTFFTGSQNQLLTNNGTISNSTAAALPATGIGAVGTGSFNNWTVNKAAGTLTLAGTASVFYTPSGSTLAIIAGVLNDAGKTINVQGNIVNSGFHQSVGTGAIILNGAAMQTVGGDGSGVFGNLRVLNTGLAAGAVAVTLTGDITVSNILTLQSTHIMAIGAYRLSLTNVATNAIGPAGGFSNQRMIQTAGNASDLGMQKTWGGAQSFTFPVGTGTKFTPATIDLQLATSLSKYGQVSVSPANLRNPFVTSTTNSLAYFWKVRSTGFGAIPNGAVFSTFRMVNTDAAGTIANYIGGRYQPVEWNTSFSTSGSVTDFTTYSEVAFSGMNQFEGEFTAGEPATFGPITSFYSRGSGNWTANTTWSTTGYAGAAVPAGSTAGTNFPGPGNPVFIGSAGNNAFHTVTVSAATTAKSGSLVIDRGSTLDIGVSTGHNFGSLPDSKIGGSGRLRISSNTATATFPGGDFGTFIQYGGGTVEYYTTGTQDFTLPLSSGSLTLNQYRILALSPAAGRTITLPAQNLRIYAQLQSGSSSGAGTTLINAAAAGNLRVDSLLHVQTGILRLPATTTRTITLDTDLRINSGATFDVVNNAGLTHAVNLGGTLTNNGTLDFNVGTGKVALTFSGGANNSLTGPTGVLTDLSTLTLNKGTGRAATLTVDVAGTLTTPTNSWLFLTNGTLRYAKGTGTLTIHDAASPYLITENAGLTIDAPGATATIATAVNAAADVRLAGEIRVLQGTLNVGTTATTAGNDLEYSSAGSPTLRVATGGNLYVNGQVRRTVNNLDGSLRYDQSGGTVNIDGVGASAAQSNERGLFEVQGPGSIFRMTSGSLNLHRSNQKSPITTADLYLNPDSTVVTGGTVRLGNATAGVGTVRISVNSAVPLYDLVVEPGSTGNINTGLLAGPFPLNLKGSLTIGASPSNGFAYFNANGVAVNIDQHLNNYSTSTSTALAQSAVTTYDAGGFQPGSAFQTTTFTGQGPALQQLVSAAGNLTMFGALTLNNAQTNGTLQLGGNARVGGILTLTKGTLEDNGNTITALGQVLNSATHNSSLTSGSLVLGGATNQAVGGNGLGKFGNLTLNNPQGATTTANQEVTKVLTLTNGVLFIGSNLLNLSNTSAAAVAGTFGNSRCIRTNGIVADLGVRKSYPAGASNFTFPVGAAVVTKYTPVQLNVISSSSAGTITVQPIDIPHPSTTDAANRELSYYWKVSSTGLASPTVSQVFSYAATDVNGTESSYKLGRFVNGQWTPQGGVLASSVNTTARTLTNLNASYIDGDYTGGEPTEFGVVPTFYSRNATAGTAGGANWTDVQTWTLTADGSGASAGAVPTLANPVIILPGHLVNSASAGRGAASLVLNGTLDLGTNLANNFSTVSGAGVLRIGSAIFPAGNYTNFVASGTGTVEFTGGVQLPARDTYNNLTLSGNNTKQLTNLDLTINGTLNVGAGTTVDNTTSQNLTLTSASNGASIAGTLNLNDGSLTTSAFLTTTATGVVNQGAGVVRIGTTLTNNGTFNRGTALLAVANSFNNTGSYNATTAARTGALSVGGNLVNSNEFLAGVGNTDVVGNLTIAPGANFQAGNGEVNTGLNFTNGGTYAATTANVMHVNGDFINQASGSFDAANSNIVLRANFTNSGSFQAGSSLVQFITNTNRFLNGNTSFWDLQKLGNSALTFGPSTNVRVGNLMTIQNSVIYTGNSTGNILYLDNTAIQPIVGYTLTSYVVGRVAMAIPDAANAIRVFPVGAGQRYRPVTIKPLGTSASAVVLVEVINGSAPNANTAGNVDATLQNVSTTRYYRIQLLSGTINQPTVQLSFNTEFTAPSSGDETVNVPGNLRVARSNGNAGVWSTTGGSGVYSPEKPSGYTTSGATTIDANSFFVIGSTNQVDNPLSGIPLPVELLAFSATRQGTAVQVAWATASEKNSAYFAVERSADGRTFGEIARVEALGNSTARHDYGTSDRSPLGGTSYYRLRQVDKDGTTTYSNVATVRFEGKAGVPSLVAYPNPATGNGFRLATVNLAPASGTVRVFDNVGRLVFSQTVAAGTADAVVQPTQSLASGMYFATWTTSDGVKLTTKVSVE